MQNTLDRENGFAAGKEWASQRAEPSELERLARYSKVLVQELCSKGGVVDVSWASIVEHFIRGRSKKQREWLYVGWKDDSVEPSVLWLRGFIGGACEAHEKALAEV